MTTTTTTTTTPTSSFTASSTPSRRLVLVTGGSRGLGRSAVLALAARGFDIAFTYVRDEAAAATVAREARERGARALALRLDSADLATFPAFVRTLQQQMGRGGLADRLHGLVHNGATGLHAPYESTTPAEFDAQHAVHVRGPFFLTQALLPLMADGGRILHVSSGLTRFTVPGYAAYAAMKGAVEVMTRYLAKELGARGLRVNTIAPGAIATDFNGGAVRDTPALNAALASQTALGRVGEPDDIGPLVASMMDDAHGWLTGQRVEASGGMFL